MDRKLTLQELEYVQGEVKSKGKSTTLTYILTLLLSPLGIHLGYLEKIGLSIARFILTLISLTSFFFVDSTITLLKNSELKLRLQQYSSVLSVILVGSLIFQLLWLLFDLIIIPRYVRKINSEIEKEAESSILQSRYALEALRKEEVSKTIIEEVTKNVNERLEKEIDERLKDAKEQVNTIEVEIKETRENVSKVINGTEEGLMKLKILTDNFGQDLEDIGKLMNDEITSIKEDIKKAHEDISNEIEKVRESTTEELKNERLKNEEKIESLKDDVGKGVSSIKQQLNELNEEVSKRQEDNEVHKIEVDKNESSDRSNEPDNNDKLREKDDKLSVDDAEVSEVNSKDTSNKRLDLPVEIDVNKAKGTSTSEANISKHKEYDKEVEQIYIDEETSVKRALQEISGTVTAKGYIIGYMTQNGPKFDNKAKRDSNVIIADTKDERNMKNVLIIRISKRSNLRKDVGLRSNPSLLGKQLEVTGKRGFYFNHGGIVGVSSIDIK